MGQSKNWGANYSKLNGSKRVEIIYEMHMYGRHAKLVAEKYDTKTSTVHNAYDKWLKQDMKRFKDA